MTVRIVRSDNSWIEGEAERQLAATAALPGMTLAVGLPDLHPGRGQPIGATFLSTGIVYPHLVGSDIGCGMALFATELSAKKPKRDKWADRLRLEGPWPNAPTDDELAASLGTIGSGNHFAELTIVEDIVDTEAAHALALDRDRVQLLVHSGSRGLGASILRRHVAQHQAHGLADDSDDARQYLADHDRAVTWAEANRQAIATRVGECLGSDIMRLCDACHNSVEKTAHGWLHRKGAAPHDRGVVVIAGSRGTPSYLMRPVGDGGVSGWSLAHGAGRKWKRSEARARVRERFSPSELVQTPLGGRVICEDRDLLYEEAPTAYKNITQVIADLEHAGVASIVATLHPLVTYKTRTDVSEDEE